ncbi:MULTISPECIES: hypothetical protein [Streptomyces]|uniref:hypothetical protein n=1 Tax=Streptomyces TaxID=1883 RepID=UPI001D104BCF|nr:hypothetical protein [Streptomyces sp. CT1-17]MCC2266293.1 hypothetical protein [Streptomyces sp. CT1-17]
MNADWETSHNMAQHDIAPLLADAADEVRIGAAPTQALVRGGRRRKALRWAIVATTSLVVAGSTAAVALSGLSGGGDGDGEVSPAKRPVASAEIPKPHMRTILASGTDMGMPWSVYVDVWKAPADTAEARATLEAMAKFGEHPETDSKASELVGKVAHFVHRVTGEEERTTQIADMVPSENDVLSGSEYGSVSLPLRPENDTAARLVIGQVAKTAKEVTCTWKDRTSTKVGRASADIEANTADPVIHSIKHSPYDWFVCLAPESTEFDGVKVTK